MTAAVGNAYRSGDSCLKYTVINNDDERSVEWESSFCGQVALQPILTTGNMQVTTQWNGEVVSSGNCYTERDVSDRDKQTNRTRGTMAPAPGPDP